MNYYRYILFLLVLLTPMTPHAESYSISDCNRVWDKARNYAESDNRLSRDYIYAKQMCSQKGRTLSSAESQSIGASYANIGLSFGSGSNTAEQYQEKACQFVSDSEKSSGVNISKLNRLSEDAGNAYNSCLNLINQGVHTNVELSDTNAGHVFIGMYVPSSQTNLSGIRQSNFECSLEANRITRESMKISDIRFPMTVSGGADGALNLYCQRGGNTKDSTSGIEKWPAASIALQFSGNPVVFSFSEITNLPPRDADLIHSEIEKLKKIIESHDLKMKEQSDRINYILSSLSNKFPAHFNDYVVYADVKNQENVIQEGDFNKLRLISQNDGICFMSIVDGDAKQHLVVSENNVWYAKVTRRNEGGFTGARCWLYN